MKTFKPLALAAMSRPIEFQRRFFLGVSAISFCPIGHRPPARRSAMWKFSRYAAARDGVDKPARFAAGFSSLAAPARAACGHCGHRHGDAGSVTKQLTAVGDRWIRTAWPPSRCPSSDAAGLGPRLWRPKFARDPLGRGMGKCRSGCRHARPAAQPGPAAGCREPITAPVNFS